jgi:hypothetical protein
MAFWPTGVRQVVDLDSFIAAFATLGFVRCADDTLERGFEKVALFASAKGTPTHAARQMPGGRWTSKMGRLEDIAHTLYSVGGTQYGEVACYLKRAIKPAATPPAPAVVIQQSNP